jgi:hypothetical protein
MENVDWHSQVELLPVEADKALERLNVTPHLFGYSREYYKVYRKIFSLNGFLVFFGDSRDIDKMTGRVEDHGLIQFKNWANNNYPAAYGDRIGLGDTHYQYEFVKFPNGAWGVRKIYFDNWITVGDKGVTYVPPAGSYRNDYNRLSGNDVTVFQTMEKEFPLVWREARSRLRKSLKISGKAQKHKETKIDKDYARRTNIRMEVAAQAAHSRDMLESYLKSLNDETMTVQEIGKLYDELIKLVALNKDMKKIYGSKMKKA